MKEIHNQDHERGAKSNQWKEIKKDHDLSKGHIIIIHKQN